MAKKKEKALADAVVAPAVAVAPAVSAPAVAADSGDLSDFLEQSTTAAPTAATKNGPEEVKLEDKKLLGKVHEFITETAKRNAALGRMGTLDADIRPSFITLWFALCRKSNQFFKTLKIDGLVNFGSPQLKIGTPNEATEPKLTAKLILQKLKEFWGTDFAKYIETENVVSLKKEATTKAGITMIQQALDRVELTDAATDTLLALVTEANKKSPTPQLAEALKELNVRKVRVIGGQTYNKMFQYNTEVGFVEEKVGDEKVVVLKRDMALNPVIETKVRECIKNGLLALNDGSITSNGDAVAAAEARIVEEEVKRLNNQSNLANAAAAGAAAGAAMAAKSA